MHILIITESFPPETKSASTLFFELAGDLVKRGFKVSVITRLPRYNIADSGSPQAVPLRETMSGIEVHRRPTPPLARNIPFIRGFEHFLLAVIFFLAGSKIRDIDLVLVYSPPLPLGIAGYWLGRLRKKPLVVNIQDLYPQTVIDLGLLKNKLLIKVSKMMEHFVYRRSDRLTVHSAGNKEYVVQHGASDARTVVINNWVDTELIKPEGKTNRFSEKYSLFNQFIVSFAGVMGFAQGLDVVVETARLLRDRSDLKFVLVGDGVKKDSLQARAKELELDNVIFVPTQPLKIYPQILAASDIGLVTLRGNLLTPAVPGKLLSIMAAGKPVIASLPLGGDAPRLIEAYRCGVCVPPDDPAALAKAVINLYNNSSLREELGRNGRKAAETVFARTIAADRYGKIFTELISKTTEAM